MHDISKLIADIKNSSGYWEETARLDFAVMLNEEMKNQGINNSQLAERIGVSKSYISKVLGGESTNFTLKSMAKFMFAMGKRLCFYCVPLIQESHAGSVSFPTSITENSNNATFANAITDEVLRSIEDQTDIAA